MKKFTFIISFIFCCSVLFADTFDTDLRKKISQMIIVGFNGTEITQDNPV